MLNKLQSNSIYFVFQMAIFGLMCVFAKAIQCQNRKRKSKNPVLLNSAEWLDKAAQAQFYDSQIENLNCLTDTWFCTTKIMLKLKINLIINLCDKL